MKHPAVVKNFFFNEVFFETLSKKMSRVPAAMNYFESTVRVNPEILS